MDKGNFDLLITHEKHRIAEQGNVPTILNWGDAIDIIRGIDIIGKTLSLYKIQDSSNFVIEIS